MSLDGSEGVAVDLVRAAADLRALEREEEEGSVAYYRTAHGRPVLITFQAVVGLLGRIIRVWRSVPLRRIQVMVPHVQEAAAMEFVGPRLGDGIDDPTRVSAKLRAEVVRLDAELLQRIRIRQRHGGVAVVVIVLTAIQDVVGRVSAATVNRNRRYPGIGRARGHARAPVNRNPCD